MPTNSETLDIPDIEDIHQALRRIQGQIRQTPVLNAPGLDRDLACQLFFKCEHLQHTGAFKFRGACNAIARLRLEKIDGDVASHSSGNHGAALAAAARLDDRTAHIVMPENASQIKIESVKRNGGRIYFCAPTQNAREQGLSRLVQTGYIPIPPYDHFDIIAGQGTAALELIQSNPDLDIMLAPVGGGGLIGGTALVANHHGLEVYAAEPAGAADTADSLAQGRRVDSYQADTIADGLRALVGIRNFAIIQQQVKQVLTVTDEEIRSAMSLFWSHMRMLIEPSSAVVIAAVIRYPKVFVNKKVGVIITGSNIDPKDWLSLTETPE